MGIDIVNPVLHRQGMGVYFCFSVKSEEKLGQGLVQGGDGDGLHDGEGFQQRTEDKSLRAGLHWLGVCFACQPM